MRIGEAKNVTDLVEACETARQRRLDKRRGFETMWWNNIALVTGDHYATWNPTLSQYNDVDPTWMGDMTGKKPRMVVNHSLTVARTELSKMIKSKPIMEVIANSNEPVDLAATKVGRAALDYAEWRFKLNARRKEALWWMIQTGLGGLFVGWDPNNEVAGKVSFVIDPATGDPAFNPEREGQLKRMVDDGEMAADDLKTESFPLGEVDVQVYSPFQLLPDETALNFQNLKDLITQDVLDVDVAKGLYGRKADGLKPESNLQLGTMETRMLQRAGVPGGMAGIQDLSVDSGAQINTFWLLPNIYRGNKFLEKGVMLRWANGRMQLDFQPTFPFQDSRIPFVWFQHIMASTSIWPDSIITQIRSPNLELDKTVSQLIENKDYMSNPMWVIATQHKIRGEIKNVAGSIVRYRHVPNIPPPAPIPGVQMPSQVENIVAALRDQILDVSGQSEVSRGRVPSGARSGVAVAYMQEEDDSKIAPTVDTFEESVALMGSLILERFSQFYSFDRILRFYRRDGVFDVRKFKGADLKDNTDVICQAGTAMPRSKAARQQYALELASLGIETDPRELKQMLELGEGEPDDTDKAIEQANRENNKMMYGVYRATTTTDLEPEAAFSRMSAAVPVKAWHNHTVHIARHTSVMMDEEFDDLSVSHPEIVRLFDEHLNMHYQQLQQQQQQQMLALQAAKGAPDGPPTPPGGAPQANGGAPAATATNVSKAVQPDPIGGGTLTNYSRQIRPQ
jgi:hypothetical protein